MSDTLSKEDIIKLLPHREPMLLIDELNNIKKLHSATAIVNVKKNSFYVQGHFPDQPVLDGLPLQTQPRRSIQRVVHQLRIAKPDYQTNPGARGRPQSKVGS